MASLNLAGKTSGYVKLTAPDDSSTNPTVTLPTESGELALKSDIGEGGGSGGGDYTPTVAFRGELSATQTVENNTWVKINLDTATIDTDSALVDGKFQPSVAGYYQANGAVYQSCGPSSTLTVSQLHKNGEAIAQGNDCNSDVSRGSQVSDVVYLNGTTDYLELFGYVKTTGTAGIDSNDYRTYLSAVLVSGGSASGDSIWTEEDGKAVYDGDGMKVLVDGTEAMSIEGDPTIGKVKIGTAAGLQIQNVQTTSDSSNIPNCYIGDAGDIVKQTNPTVYSIEQVDKKLAIKDKLIEKLSERLDALEKKLKK